MKKTFLLAFGLLSMGAFAQNTPWSTTGNIGVGTTSPVTSLEIQKQFGFVQQTVSSTSTSFSTFLTNVFPSVKHKLDVIHMYNPFGTQLTTKLQAFYNTSSKGFISFPTDNLTTTLPALTFGYSSVTAMSIMQDGKTKIGSISSTPNGYKLFVEDGILTEKVKVAVEGTSNWADYVFADDYQLMPLNEVEAFTKENKHLPNVPSAQEMVTEGLDVAQMDAKLLEKVEELTLYLIEQNKKLEAQNEKLEKQSKQMEQQNTMINTLKKEIEVLKETK